MGAQKTTFNGLLLHGLRTCAHPCEVTSHGCQADRRRFSGPDCVCLAREAASFFSPWSSETVNAIGLPFMVAGTLLPLALVSVRKPAVGVPAQPHKARDACQSGVWTPSLFCVL